MHMHSLLTPGIPNLTNQGANPDEKSRCCVSGQMDLSAASRSLTNNGARGACTGVASFHGLIITTASKVIGTLGIRIGSWSHIVV